MPNPNDVNSSESSTETDDRGIPIKNLQAEVSRKLEKVEEAMNAKFEALAQKLDGLTRDDDSGNQTASVTPDKREELLRISADPHGYVDSMVQPLRESNAKLEQQTQELRKATLRAQWERMEDRIADKEGKRDWKDLDKDFQDSIKKEIIGRGWQNNPDSAMDAYDIVKARKVQSEASDPDRLARIRNNQPEGSGRNSSSRGTTQTVSRDTLTDLSRTLPSNPDYKKNMELLDKVQKGLVKVEG